MVLALQQRATQFGNRRSAPKTAAESSLTSTNNSLGEWWDSNKHISYLIWERLLEGLKGGVGWRMTQKLLGASNNSFAHINPFAYANKTFAAA